MKGLNISALREALREAILIDLAESEDVLGATLQNPDLFLKQIYERHGNNKSERSHLSKKQILAALIAAILIIASAVTAIAFKDKILGFFESKEDTNTSLISPGGEGTNDKIKEVFLPTYIPEGFVSKTYECYPIVVNSVWSNGKDNIIFAQMPIKNTQLSWNTEKENYTEALFGNQPIYYLINKNSFSAVWHTEDYVYTFDAPSSLGLDEIEKIIASISYYKSVS